MPRKQELGIEAPLAANGQQSFSDRLEYNPSSVAQTPLTINYEVLENRETTAEIESNILNEQYKLDTTDLSPREKYQSAARSAARTALKSCAGIILAGLASTLAFTIQNDEDMHLLIGLPSNSRELDFTSETGCKILQDDSALSSGEKSADKIRSSAYENNPLGMISTKPTDQYYKFFKNYRESYKSNLTGIEYRLYIFDQKDTSTIDNVNMAVVEQIEMSIFNNTNYSDHPTTKSKMACMRTEIVDKKNMGGRVIPLVVPADPACLADLKIIYQLDKCSQIGFTMPYADLDFGPWDLNPVYNEFILLTTGSSGREISNELTAHELIHKFYEGFKAGGYELNLQAEEKFVKFTDGLIENDRIFEALPPIITYKN